MSPLQKGCVTLPAPVSPCHVILRERYLRPKDLLPHPCKPACPRLAPAGVLPEWGGGFPWHCPPHRPDAFSGGQVCRGATCTCGVGR
ncbi:MAG: hypothetical protein MUP03_00345 [Anaerolineales bacterium]|nr:hypothetical protein [Anaerolineales bacterium]